MSTIQDIEKQLEIELSETLKKLGLEPPGYQCEARLHGKSRNKRRDASFEKYWSPDTDSIIIQFKPSAEQTSEPASPPARPSSVAPSREAGQSRPAPADPLSDLIRALDRAESRPGYTFVALKWFRDTALPSEGFAWASIVSERQVVLRDAIDQRLVLTGKMDNPRSPQFPVTAIRLNRLMPRVKAALGLPADALPDFQPVSIRGEALSATVLRDRR